MNSTACSNLTVRPEPSRRRDQPSNRFLEDELNQQKVMSITIPFIFFGVAAFLLNVVARASGDRAARADRRAESAWLSDDPARVPLSQTGRRSSCCSDRHSESGGRLRRSASAMIASYHGFFRLPVLVFVLTPWSALAGFGDQPCGCIARRRDGAAKCRHPALRQSPCGRPHRCGFVVRGSKDCSRAGC